MPNISEQTKQKYWNHILGLEDPMSEKLKREISETDKEKIKERILIDYSNIKKDKDWLQSIEKEYELNEFETTQIAIEALDNNVNEVKHLFLAFY